MQIALERHSNRVTEIAQSAAAAARCRLSASWRRSLIAHRLDPLGAARPKRVEDRALAHRREAGGPLVATARDALDGLFNLVALSGCAVLLTDPDGIVLEARMRDGDRATFAEWGLRPGFDWSEAAQGTNGIGTCVAEARPVTIHRGDHYLARNTAMSCIDAPIFGAEGALAGIVDISSARSDQTHGMNRLMAAAVAQAAHRIEAGLFRAAHPGARIVATGDGAAPGLLAVDRDDLVIGATRAARRALDLPRTERFAPRPAADLLGQHDAGGGVAAAERAALRRALARADGNASAAARSLGMSRATLYRRMNRLGLSRM